MLRTIERGRVHGQSYMVHLRRTPALVTKVEKRACEGSPGIWAASTGTTRPPAAGNTLSWSMLHDGTVYPHPFVTLSNDIIKDW